jgi:hypothetical protein
VSVVEPVILRWRQRRAAMIAFGRGGGGGRPCDSVGDEAARRGHGVVRVHAAGEAMGDKESSRLGRPLENLLLPLIRHKCR